MINLPNFEDAFEHENDFYLSCEGSRIAKLIAHFKFLEITAKIKGEIIECGVFKGASFSRFAMYRKILNLEHKKLIGFDTFGGFPETNYEKDKEMRKKFIEEAGEESISKGQLEEVLKNKDCFQNTDLIKGDIVKTVPEFMIQNPKLKISLLNLDVDIYEPTVTILKNFYERISEGGLLILDDFNSFPGETSAVKEYFSGKNVKIMNPIFPNTPYFIQKKTWT